VRPAIPPYSPVSFVFAATQASHSTGAKTVSAAHLFLQLFIGLAVILGLIFIVGRVLKGRVGLVRRVSAPLAVIGRQPLGKGVQVAIVKAGTDTYLLGVTAHQVTRLGRYNEQDPDMPVSTDDLPPAAPAGPGGPRWQSALRQIQDRTVRRA
jgi:flagellar biogenesis protein FliO